jgi:coenzyme F420-reducing hydrogenase gamma subunit
MSSNNSKKLKIGWFSFSCSEDSTIMFTEMLNSYWDKWKNKIEFKHIKVLQSKNTLEDIDIAFIEGAVTSAEQKQEVKKIRQAAKKVVTIGSCATCGLPSGQRNQFDKDTQASIQYLIDRFGQSAKVKSIPEVIKVDDKVPGCPMNEEKFLEVLEKYLREFRSK